MQFQSRCWLRTLDILLGTRGATAKMAPTQGCGQEAWLSCHVILFMRLLEHPYCMAADPTQVSDPTKSKEEITVLLIVLEATYTVTSASLRHGLLSPIHIQGEGNCLTSWKEVFLKICGHILKPPLSVTQHMSSSVGSLPWFFWAEPVALCSVFRALHFCLLQLLPCLWKSIYPSVFLTRPEAPSGLGTCLLDLLCPQSAH